MKNVIKQIVIVLSLSGMSVSCAPVEPRPDNGTDVDFRGSDCISIRTIRDYTPLDRSTLLIEGMGNRDYLVTLVSPALELRSSFRMGFSSRDDWLCPYGGDRLVFDGMANDSIMIRGISKVTPEQKEDLLIRYGKKEPEELNDQAPPDVKGADVEELGEIG